MQSRIANGHDMKDGQDLKPSDKIPKMGSETPATSSNPSQNIFKGNFADGKEELTKQREDPKRQLRQIHSEDTGSLSNYSSESESDSEGGSAEIQNHKADQSSKSAMLEAEQNFVFNNTGGPSSQHTDSQNSDRSRNDVDHEFSTDEHDNGVRKPQKTSTSEERTQEQISMAEMPNDDEDHYEDSDESQAHLSEYEDDASLNEDSSDEEAVKDEDNQEGQSKEQYLPHKGRQKRKAATIAVKNVKSFIAKEEAPSLLAVKEQSPAASLRPSKKQKTDGSYQISVKLQLSLQHLGVPVLVKTNSDELVRASDLDTMTANGISEQSMFASKFLSNSTDRPSKKEITRDPSVKSQKVKLEPEVPSLNLPIPVGQKLNRRTQQLLRLRADGTPKRKYQWRNPRPVKGQAQDGQNKESAKPENGSTRVLRARNNSDQKKKLPPRKATQRKGKNKKGRMRDELEDHSSDSEFEIFEKQKEEEQEEFDELFGCSGCRWKHEGCDVCRKESPVMKRSKSVRWKADQGRPQQGIPEAPTFYPTEEEFADPLSYINKIREHGEKSGIACIVPPKGWSPPFALDKGTNGQSAESFRFSIRKQPTWQLCMRSPNPKSNGAPRSSAHGRVDAEKPDEVDENHIQADHEPDESGFGFVTLDRTHTLASFEAYAKWAKSLHFGMKEGDNGPSVDELEAEFWRIVETPEEAVENLYGQDLDSGHHGSGFPLPPSRKRKLEELLRQKLSGQEDTGNVSDGSEGSEQSILNYTPEEQAYSEHCWNINNLPRCKGSVLRYVIGDELITGVMVPWLYVGSCMSAFCWHIEDHALYSINYLHKGAPKIWYGVPSNASEALDEAMRDAFPEHFKTAPDLLYQLVTMLSPSQLKARGVPVSRVVHKEGSFVITFPNAYHSGFNAGFNCAEAVNFAPPDWLPWGCNILQKYRRDRKAATLSSDALLIALVKGAAAVQAALKSRADIKQLTKEEEFKSEGTDRKSILKEECNAILDSVDKKDQGDGDESSSSKDHTSTPVTNVPGQRADTSFLDKIKVEDAPANAVRLAIAELQLRVQEERRRRGIGLKETPNIEALKMSGQPGDKNDEGLLINTEDMDCQDCKCDLWMSAIVSRSSPGQHFCPEHAPQMQCPKEEWILLYRYTLEELDAMLEEGIQALGGMEDAMAIVNQVHNPPKVEVKKLGPIAALIPQGSPQAQTTPPVKPKKLQRAGKRKVGGRSPNKQNVSVSPPEALGGSRKRQRKAKVEEDEEVENPKKITRGPGKRRATVVRESEAAIEQEASDYHSDSEGWSPVVDDGAIDDESDSAPKKGRRGRRPGPKKGKQRGRRKGKAKPPDKIAEGSTQAVTDSKSPSPSDQEEGPQSTKEEPADQISEQEDQVSELKDTLKEESGPLEEEENNASVPSKDEANSEPLPVSDTQAPEQKPAYVQPPCFIPKPPEASSSIPVQSTAPCFIPKPAEPLRGNTAEAHRQASSFAAIASAALQQRANTPAGTNSVLMDILRASMLQPTQGHLTQGSIPRVMTSLPSSAPLQPPQSQSQGQQNHY